MEEEEHPILTAVVKAGLVLALFALIGGYMGRLHPLGDSLSVGRGAAAAAVFLLSLLAIVAGMRLAAFGAILLSILTGTSVALAYLWPGPPGTFALYQKNLFYANSALAEVEADIRAADPVAITLQEVSPANTALLAALGDAYPHQFHCTQGTRGGTAVLSRAEPVPGAQVCVPGLAAMQVRLEDRDLWIVSVHLSWPWPYDQADHVASLLPVLQGLEGPVVMGGDFNMVRWGWSVQRLAAYARVMPAGPMRGTFGGLIPHVELPIDHVLAPRGGRVTYRDALGSDHRGLLAMLAL